MPRRPRIFTDDYDDIVYVYEYKYHYALFTADSVRTGIHFIWDKCTLLKMYPNFDKYFIRLDMEEARIQMALGTIYKLDHFETPEGKKYALRTIGMRI